MVAASSKPVAIVNACGVLGAYLSGTVLYYLGLVGFGLPLMPLVLVVCRQKIITLCFLGQVVLCFLYGLEVYAPVSNLFGIEMPTAGHIGYWLTDTINSSFGVAGSHIIIITILGYLILIATRLHILLRVGHVIAGLAKNRTPRPQKINPVEPKEKIAKIKIFSKSVENNKEEVNTEYKETADLIQKTLAEFKIMGKILGWHSTPVVTIYEFQPQPGIKQSQITSLANDLALALKVNSIFILPVAGQKALGIQVPNTHRHTVRLGDILQSDRFRTSKSKLTFALGKGAEGEPVCYDLQSMPHLLIAGSTGSGKSVAINSLLCSILSRAAPDEVKLILVDPKMLELSVYDGIPHLLRPVITDVPAVREALSWVIDEMQRRYELLKQLDVRNIDGFRQKWERLSYGEKSKLRQMGKIPADLNHLPSIVFVIDELADLMLNAPREIESSIQRIAQKARASGIHLVLATQRPSVDIITGVIKSNLPCRIAFRVASRHDSRTIMDIMGAEKLLGKGDMLFQYPGNVRPQRIQGTLVTDEEVQNLVSHLKKNF